MCTPAGPSDPGSRPVLDPTSPDPRRDARNIVLRERADDTNTQDNCHRMIEPIRRPVHSRPPSFGAEVPSLSAEQRKLYQRNSENLSKDRAALGQEIRKSVAELFDVALESRA